MKKRIAVSLLILIIATMSNIAVAVVPPAPGSPFDVVCNRDIVNCKDGVTYNFAPGEYTFSINDGWWLTEEFPSPDYYWSLTIDLGAGNTFLLGDGQKYGSESAVNTARNNNSAAFEQTFVFAGGDISFTVPDPDGIYRDNEGTISVAYDTVIVPEPVSTTLFIIGGVVLGGRSFLRRKRINN